MTVAIIDSEFPVADRHGMLDMPASIDVLTQAAELLNIDIDAM